MAVQPPPAVRATTTIRILHSMDLTRHFLARAYKRPRRAASSRIRLPGQPDSPAASIQLHQEPGQQLRPHRQAVDQNVLIERVRAGAADAEPIERGDIEIAGEIRV